MRHAGSHVGPLRVAVVDDDDINRRGMTSLLATEPDIEIRASLNHDEALAESGRWAEIDVVIVDAADRRREGDQFPGVQVVRRIRRYRPPGELIIVVVTGHYFDDAVRRRMREAQADYFYHRGDMADAEVLRDVVLRSERAHSMVPEPADPEALIRLGVTTWTRVNQAVTHALGHEIERELAERRDPRSRRWQRLRALFNKEARLTPMTSDGRLPDRRQDLPSLPSPARAPPRLRGAT
jgi:CheY-like chemotaxis protein